MCIIKIPKEGRRGISRERYLSLDNGEDLGRQFRMMDGIFWVCVLVSLQEGGGRVIWVVKKAKWGRRRRGLAGGDIMTMQRNWEGGLKVKFTKGIAS